LARLLEILKSKAFRAGLLLVVFFAALGSGLAYLVRERADAAQITALEAVVDGAREPVSGRFAILEDDVRDAVRRVVAITSDVMKDSEGAAAATPETGEEATPPAPALPLEERWRIRLAASLGELLESRSDVLDVTYLGRFSGVPSGSLMVARVERDKQGTAQPTQEDPRPDWDGSFLQEVISHEGEAVVLSEPSFPTPAEGVPPALVRGATPVRGSDGSVVGVVLVSVDMSDALAAVRAGLPAAADVLLATAEGASLLHPVEDLALARGQSANELLAATYPELDLAAREAGNVSSFGHVGSTRVARLLRFDVGQGDKKLALTLAVSAPIADVDLVAVFTPMLGGGVGYGLLAIVVVAGAGGALLWRRRQAGEDEDEDDDEAPTALEARAEAIEADGEPAEDAPGDAVAASAEGNVEEEQEEETEEDGETEPLAASPEDADAVIGAPPDDDADEVEEASFDEPESDGGEAMPADEVPPAAAEPARELASARSRLEDELEAARQRALDELAAARERFEAELTAERERAIERLVTESRDTLARELGEEVDATVAERRPALEQCEFDLRQLLGEVAAWLEGEAHGRASRFGVRCSRQVPERLLGDPEWVGPLLVHLARNAMQSSDDAPVELYVSCKDDGPAAVKLCFELLAPETGLYTDASGRLCETGATGASSLAEELVDAMHGDMRIERESQAGSCVRVTLPMPLPG
jgi:hypothetical protein